MATYDDFMYANPVPDDIHVRCDEHSSFDPSGFASDNRCWSPIYGGPCEVCHIYC